MPVDGGAKKTLTETEVAGKSVADGGSKKALIETEAQFQEAHHLHLLHDMRQGERERERIHLHLLHDMRQAVQEEVESLLRGEKSPKRLKECVDVADPRARADMITFMCKQLQVMGLVVRSLHSVQHMLQSSMDQGQSVASFRREVLGILGDGILGDAALPDQEKLEGSGELGIWLVDQPRNEIWKWQETTLDAANPTAKRPPQIRRPLVVSERGDDIADGPNKVPYFGADDDSRSSFGADGGGGRPWESSR
ncbi:hypothetical protein T484DRAFT_1897269, partial [Baffinella frigidus]